MLTCLKTTPREHRLYLQSATCIVYTHHGIVFLIAAQHGSIGGQVNFLSSVTFDAL